MRLTVLTAALLGTALFAQEPAEKPIPGPTIGKAVPTFRVNDHRGSAVRVGGTAKTWTVLAFFPKAATPG